MYDISIRQTFLKGERQSEMIFPHWIDGDVTFEQARSQEFNLGDQD
jgi:hypothetical protein